MNFLCEKPDVAVQCHIGSSVPHWEFSASSLGVQWQFSASCTRTELTMNWHWTATELALNSHWTATELPLNWHWTSLNWHRTSMNWHWTSLNWHRTSLNWHRASLNALETIKHWRWFARGGLCSDPEWTMFYPWDSARESRYSVPCPLG